jgi:hypothetical protein
MAKSLSNTTTITGHIYRRITAVVPAPVGPVARFRLIRDGVVIAERANDAAPPAVAASATIARNDATWTLSWSNAICSGAGALYSRR